MLGVGPERFKYYSARYGNIGGLKGLEGTRKSHNLILGLAAEVGVIGLSCFALLILVTLRGLIRVRTRDRDGHGDAANMASGFILVITVYLMTGLFAHFSFVRYFWLMVALANSAIVTAEFDAYESKEPHE